MIVEEEEEQEQEEQERARNRGEVLSNMKYISFSQEFKITFVLSRA